MISKTAEYALRAIACLSTNPGAAFSADVLAARSKVPRRYLHRVLQDLVSAEIVRSRPGPGGGYELVIDIERLNILDIVNAVSPIERIKSCPLGLPFHITLCPLHAELDRAYAATEEAFKSVTFSELMKSATFSPLCETSPETVCVEPTEAADSEVLPS
ncbi:MAG TPA: Rrf2 family transcriptional regulator [Planctomycetaceae bacterium]|nr:Rrf2 family transcriptional regulator [Planctomycetaceae bacterium]